MARTATQLRDGCTQRPRKQDLQVWRETGFGKAHVREDPHCRLHGVTGGGGGPTQPESLRDYTFSTTRRPWTSGFPDGGYEDTQTGEVLNREHEENYEQYRQRWCDRCRVGEQADRLVHIVDCYSRFMPKISDESRAYVMRYPSQVRTMLQTAWKIREQIRANRRGKRRAILRKRSDTSATPEPENRGKVQRRAEERAEPKTMAREATLPHARKRTPPDWGDDDSLDNSPANKPHEEHVGEGCSSGRMAEKPSEPIGEPPKRRSQTVKAKPNEPVGDPATAKPRHNKAAQCGGGATDGGGKGEREPCSQSQLASSTSASTHVETGREHVKKVES